MAGLFGGSTKVIPEFTGLQINTAVQVIPIPIIYGCPRININLIYYNGFQAKKVSAGGKGLLSGGKGAQQIEYFATILLAIGEGLMGATRIIFQNGGAYTPADYPTNGVAFFAGTPDQLPWSYIQNTWPADARPYVNTSYFAFYNAQLDSSATVPQIDLVIDGHMAGTSPLFDSTIEITTGQYDQNGNPLSFIGDINLGARDADPAEVLWDLLTNLTYGAQFPTDWIDQTSLFTSDLGFQPNVGDNSVSSFCQAAGLAWSTVLNNAESASSIVERWLKNLNVAPVWTGSVLKFVPYWDSYIDTNPGWSPINGIAKKYYAPYLTPIATISLDDILQSNGKEDDPITFTRKDPLEVYNTVRVDYRDRFNFYNDVPAEAKDEAHVELYGPRVDNIGLANEFSLGDYAQMSATLQLRRNIGVMNTYSWKMGPLWSWLTPMDIVYIPDPTNYDQFLAVRITSVEDDEDENVTVEAEQLLPAGITIAHSEGDPFSTLASGAAQSPYAMPPAPTTPPNQGPLNNPPSPAFPPVVIEPTTDMLTALGFATPQMIFGDSGGTSGIFDQNWGGVNIWTSLDGVNYEEIGVLQGPSAIGYVTQDLPPYTDPNPDVVDTVYVTLMISEAALNNFDSSSAAAGASLCVIVDASGFEAFSYTTATLVSPFTYALTGLYRGLYGTAPRAFSAGAQFLFIGTNSNVFVRSLPATYIGQSFYIKPQSFNVFNTTPEDLADVVAYRYNVSNTGGTILVTDLATATDAYTLPGEFLGTLADAAVSSDTPSLSVGVTLELVDSANSTETLSP